jgi:hypothetical protein
MGEVLCGALESLHCPFALTQRGLNHGALEIDRRTGLGALLQLANCAYRFRLPPELR